MQLHVDKCLLNFSNTHDKIREYIIHVVEVFTVSYPIVLSKLTQWGQDKWTPFRRRHFQTHFREWKC